MIEIHFESRSVLSLTDDQQTLQNSYEYDPFGNILSSIENVRNVYQYVGQWGIRNMQEARGIYFMRTRFYDSWTGRFLSLDPFGVGGKSTNLYSYANNNPLENLDPRGTIWTIALYAGTIGAAANTAVYAVNQQVTGEDIKLAGLATSAGTGLGAGFVGGITKIAASVIGGVAGAVGYAGGNQLEGKDVKASELAVAAVSGALAPLVPGANKVFGYSGSSDRKHILYYLKLSKVI